MVQTNNDVMRVIAHDKAKGKRTSKVKISQVEFFKDKHPKIYLQTMGISELEKELKAKGFTFKYEKTDKQNTISYDMNGNINKAIQRDLHTTNIVVKF